MNEERNPALLHEALETYRCQRVQDLELEYSSTDHCTHIRI